MSAHRRALREQGFFVIRNVYDADARARVGTLLDEALAETPGVADEWGREIVPLLERCPAMRAYLDLAALEGPIGEGLGESARRIYSGARFTSLGTRSFLPWHHHVQGGQGHDGRWGGGRRDAPAEIERVIATAYLDGATAENGLLYVWPRRVGDSYRPPFDDPAGPWPGHVVVALEPGDVAVWDVATYHAAHCLAGPRRIFGGVYQGVSRPVAGEDARG